MLIVQASGHISDHAGANDGVFQAGRVDYVLIKDCHPPHRSDFLVDIVTLHPW